MSDKKMVKKKFTKDQVPEGFTLRLALVDAIPVIFFAITGVLLGILSKNIIVFLGIVLCVWAGLAKVIWKIIVAVKKQNIWFLFMQMRIVMPIGFLLMLVGMITIWPYIDWAHWRQVLSWYPVWGPMVAGVIFMAAMMIMAFTLDSGNPKHNWIEQLVNSCGQLCFMLGVIMLFYTGDYYSSLSTVKDYASRYADDCIITEEADYYCISSGNTDTAYIFYPGGKVDPAAYIPLMAEVSKVGMDCYIVKMPCNLSMFGANRASIIRDSLSYEHWYIGGHSLGSIFAASYAHKNACLYDGVILLAGYTTVDMSEDDLAVAILRGSEDKLVEEGDIEKYKENLPERSTIYQLGGGNHGGFGDYGEQAGDGVASMTNEQQWQLTAQNIKLFMLFN